MRYLPHTEEEIAEMLTAVGKESLDDLFCTIPEDCRRDAEIELPPAMTEWELDAHMTQVGNMLEVTPQHKVLVGAGSYHHYIPEMIRAFAIAST